MSGPWPFFYRSRLPVFPVLLSRFRTTVIVRARTIYLFLSPFVSRRLDVSRNIAIRFYVTQARADRHGRASLFPLRLHRGNGAGWKTRKRDQTTRATESKIFLTAFFSPTFSPCFLPRPVRKAVSPTILRSYARFFFSFFLSNVSFLLSPPLSLLI